MIRQALLEYRLPVVKQDERRFGFAAVQRTVVKKQIDLRRENFDLCAGCAGHFVGLQIELRAGRRR